MSNILQLPRIRGSAGDKIYTYQTGTTTPQATYQDSDLSTPHANPIIADADGIFAPIFLDPSLPDYRITHKTSADVLISQDDDVPAGQANSQNFRLKSVAPWLIFEETDGSTNNKKWRGYVQSEVFHLQTGNDAESSWTDVLTIARDGTVSIPTLAVEDLEAASLTFDGESVATQDSGSFTASQAGYSSALTPTIQWRRTGGIVSLSCNSGSVGTSNGTGLTLGTLPAGIRPLQTMTYVTRLTDNGTVGLGVVSVGTDGTLTFGNGITGGSFTGSGNKGLPGGWSLIYEAA